MRSITAMLMAFAFTAFLCGCSSDSSDSEDEEESSSSALSSSDDKGLAGGFGSFVEISKAERTLFEETVEDFEEDYKLFDPESVSTQVVAGKNYKFLCSMETDDGDVKVYVTIYQPLPGRGEPAITKIAKVGSAKNEFIYKDFPKIEDEEEESSSSVESSSEMANDISSESKEVSSSSEAMAESSASESEEKGYAGSYSGFMPLNEGDEAFFEEMVAGYEKKLYNPELVSTQIVSGVNYKFLCSMDDGGVTQKVIVTIYKPISGETKITSVENAPEP